MIALAVVVAALVLLALSRFGAAVEYSEAGLTVTARAGPLSIQVFPRKEKLEKARKRAAKKAKKPRKAKREKKKPEKKGPGGLKSFIEIFSAVKPSLNRLRRRLLIKRLTIHYVAADADPSKTALKFGGANAVFGIAAAVLEKNFRIRRRDLRASADFNAPESRIYVNAVISLAVWEAIYIVFTLIPLFLDGGGAKRMAERTKRKDAQDNGQATDK